MKILLAGVSTIVALVLSCFLSVANAFLWLVIVTSGYAHTMTTTNELILLAIGNTLLFYLPALAWVSAMTKSVKKSRLLILAAVTSLLMSVAISWIELSNNPVSGWIFDSILNSISRSLS